MTTTNQTVLMAPPLTRTSCRPTRSRQHRPRYLLRDRDSIYGDEFTSRVGHMGIKEVKTRNRGRWSRRTKGKSSNSRWLAGFITATFGSRPSFSASRNAPESAGDLRLFGPVPHRFQKPSRGFRASQPTRTSCILSIEANRSRKRPLTSLQSRRMN